MKKPYCPVFCHELVDVPVSCCDSCHDDVEYGYGLNEFTLDGIDYEVCCKVAVALGRRYDEKT